MRTHWRRSVAALLVGAALLLTGCGDQTPPLTPPSPDASQRAICDTFVAALPQQLAGSTGVIDAKALVAHYGEGKDAILIRCGVTKPAELTPTSRCDQVNGVGWFSQERPERGYVFTTIGRATHIEVTVPGSHAPEADVLNELTPAVRTVPVVKPCQ